MGELHDHDIAGRGGDVGDDYRQLSRHAIHGDHGPAGPKNTGLRSATANAAESGGDGNGFETSPGNAHGDDTANAVDTDSGTVSSTSCTSTGRDRHRYFNYGLALSSDATINGIEVRLDSRVDSTSGSPRMCVELSWDGGVSWTAPLTSPTLSTSMTSRTLGGAANTWGRSWTPADLSNANFRVRVTTVANSTVRDFTLDWIAVRVTYQGGSSEPPPPPPPDTTPPSVSITSPAGGASVSGTTTISASASDNVGVTRVDFFVDGVLLSSDTSSPYSASWNTTSATNATHSLTARAFDAANNQTTSGAVSVTVNNTAPPPPGTATLTVTATGRSGERVTSNPAGINVSVGTTGSASFNAGTSITLERDERARYRLVGRLFERGQQGENLHVHAQRECDGDGERPVACPTSAVPSSQSRRPSRAASRMTLTMRREVESTQTVCSPGSPSADLISTFHALKRPRRDGDVLDRDHLRLLERGLALHHVEVAERDGVAVLQRQRRDRAERAGAVGEERTAGVHRDRLRRAAHRGRAGRLAAVERQRHRHRALLDLTRA